MTDTQTGDTQTIDPFDSYRVVMNDDKDYSIWPSVRDLPLGWEAVGTEGSKAECLAWIETNWTGPSI